jgi:hypothetical protein
MVSWGGGLQGVGACSRRSYTQGCDLRTNTGTNTPITQAPFPRGAPEAALGTLVPLADQHSNSMKPTCQQKAAPASRRHRPAVPTRLSCGCGWQRQHTTHPEHPQVPESAHHVQLGVALRNHIGRLAFCQMQPAVLLHMCAMLLCLVKQQQQAGRQAGCRGLDKYAAGSPLAAGDP